MNLEAGSQFSLGQLIVEALGTTLLGMVLAAFLATSLHAGLHATGALVTRARGERKFSWLLLLLGVGLGVLVGGWTGLKIGVARAVVPFVRDTGPKMLEEALQNGLRQAGLTNFAQLEVKRLREFVSQAEAAPLPPLDQLERFRPQIEEARTRLLPTVRALLDAHEKQGNLPLSAAVTQLWPKVFTEVADWERRFRRSEIISGILWVVAVELGIALLCLTLRLTRDPLPVTPPKLPTT